MDTILRIISLIFTALAIGLTIWMLVTFRRGRRIRSLVLVISACLSALILIVFTRLSGARLNPVVSIPLLLLGFLVGFAGGWTTKLTRQPGGIVIGRNSWFFLLIWGVTLALAQVLTLLESTLAASVGLIPLMFSTGTQVGNSVNLLIRRLLL